MKSSDYTRAKFKNLAVLINIHKALGEHISYISYALLATALI